MLKRALFFLCCFWGTMYGESVFLAEPPKGWECLKDPTQLPQKIVALYVGKGSGNASFTPSINIAVEGNTLPIREYLMLAKTHHEKERDVQCHILGTLKAPLGDLEILQMDRPTQWGAVRFIQAFFQKNQQAYIITATCLKQEFATLSPQIFKAIQSLTIAQMTEAVQTAPRLDTKKLLRSN